MNSKKQTNSFLFIYKFFKSNKILMKMIKTTAKISTIKLDAVSIDQYSLILHQEFSFRFHPNYYFINMF